MKINIAASHRFHLLDLARELQNLGHDVKFYSYVPTNRAVKFGLRKANSRSLLIPMLPFLALVRLTKASAFSLKLLNQMLDHWMTLFARPCDVYIALGTVYCQSLKKAKQHGATVILEWGSKHIDEQQRCLSGSPGFKPLDPYFLDRSRQGYALADYIAIASAHVRESFEARGIDTEKLFQNPYGVDLSMFYPISLPGGKPYDIIMVGGSSYAKGCDLLIEVCKNSSLKLLHVGPLVGLPFPNVENMTHIDAVNQPELVNYYAQAKVFVLPSRAEGLAMVQAQALACGLAVVCSQHSGGRDLKEFIPAPASVIEIGELNADELQKIIERTLEKTKYADVPADGSASLFSGISWTSYGLRYASFLQQIAPSDMFSDQFQAKHSPEQIQAHPWQKGTTDS